MVTGRSHSQSGERERKFESGTQDRGNGCDIYLFSKVSISSQSVAKAVRVHCLTALSGT